MNRSRVGQSVSGLLCERPRHQIIKRQSHVLGVQEAHGHEAGIFLSDVHICVCGGPHVSLKRGDTEIWIARTLRWSIQKHDIAPGKDDHFAELPTELFG